MQISWFRLPTLVVQCYLAKFGRCQRKLGRRYDRGSIKVWAHGLTYIRYKMYGLWSGCDGKNHVLAVQMGVGGPECRCRLKPVCQGGKQSAKAVVYRMSNFNSSLQCRNTQAHCLSIRLDCVGSDGCPVKYVSTQHEPKEWNGYRCAVTSCKNPNI